MVGYPRQDTARDANQKERQVQWCLRERLRMRSVAVLAPEAYLTYNFVQKARQRSVALRNQL